MKSQHNKHRRGVVLVSLTLVGAILYSSFLVGCGDPPHKKTHPWENPIFLKYRQPTIVYACRDVTGSYPPLWGQEFQTALSQSLVSAVRVSAGELRFFYQTITHDSMNTPLPPIIVPATPADDPEPALLPIPKQQPNENPVEYANKVADINLHNKSLTDTWQTALRANHQFVASVKRDMEQKAAWLASQQFSIDRIGTDILSCLNNASEAYSHYPNYQHYLLIASDLVGNELMNGLPSLNLYRAHILLLWHYCGNGNTAEICAQRDSDWRALFAHAGASDVNFYSRDTSLALQNQLF